MSVHQTINRMRAQADFLALHADLLDEVSSAHQWDEAFDKNGTAPTYEELTYADFYCSYSISIGCSGPNQADLMRRLRRAFGGKWEKTFGSQFMLSRQFDEDGLLNVYITGDRDAICTPKVTVSEEYVIPAVEAKPERVETREVVKEWDCGTLLDEDDAETLA